MGLPRARKPVALCLLLAYGLLFFVSLHTWVGFKRPPPPSSPQNRTSASPRLVDQDLWQELTTSQGRMETEACERDFGFELIALWKGSRQIWCAPTVTCYPYYQTGHGGSCDNLCVITNATLDPRPYNDHNATREIMRACVETNGGAYLEHTTRAVLYTSCECDLDAWHEEQLPGWNHKWMVAGLSVAQREPQCTDFDEVPTLLVERNGLFANLFHQTEAFFNAFLAVLIAGLHPGHVRILIADLYPLGPFESLWRHLFLDVRTAWDIKEEAPRCYRTILVGIYGPASPLTLNTHRTACARSPLVRAYARWVWASFRLWPIIKTQRPVLLWQSRQSSVLDPRRAFCDDRFFACADWAHLGIRALERIVSNEAAVLDALRGLSEPQPLAVSVADFNLLPFDEQLERVVAADILAGPHGAGLTHLLFMRDSGCVLELFVAGSEDRLHYTNLASWRGLRYGSLSADPPDPQAVVRGLVATCF